MRRGHLNQSIIGAPRGLLKALILKEGSKTPVSGVDLMKIVSRLSSGLWVPSPGSIYYLLNELVSRKMMLEVLSEGSVKKYVTTKAGSIEFERIRASIEKSMSKQLTLLKIMAEVTGDRSLSEKIGSLYNKFLES